MCENVAEVTAWRLRRTSVPTPKACARISGISTGPSYSGLAAHFRAGGSNYSQTTYDPLKAFLPGHMWTWISHVAKFWFKKKHNFRDYTTNGKGNGIYEIAERCTIDLIGDWGTGTDEAQMVASLVAKSRPDFTIHLGDVYYVGDDRGEGKLSWRENQWIHAGEMADGHEGELCAFRKPRNVRAWQRIFRVRAAENGIEGRRQ